MDERARPLVIDAGVLIDLNSWPRPRRRESRLTGLVVTSAAILAAGVAALSLDPQELAERSPGIGEAAATAGEADPRGAMPAALPVHAVFPDAQHGYVTMLRCPSGRFQECRVDLSVTSDGGATWSRRPLPNPSATVVLGSSSLYALDSGTLIFDHAESFTLTAGATSDPAPSDPLRGPVDAVQPGYTPAGRWLSVDGGRRWRRVGSVPVGTLSEIPARGQLLLPLPGRYGIQPRAAGSQPAEVAGAQVLRSDGTAAALTRGPGSGRLVWYSAGVVAGDGSIWASGRSFTEEPATDSTSNLTWLLQVSRDRGRTWQSVTTPAGRLPAEFYTVNGRRLYAVSVTAEGGPVLTYSDDAAVTWHELRMPTTGGQSVAGTAALGRLARGLPARSVAPAQDGGLVVVAGERLFRLSPSDDRLREVSGAPRVATVIPAGRWMLAVSADLTLFYSSTDGIRWRTLGLS